MISVAHRPRVNRRLGWGGLIALVLWSATATAVERIVWTRVPIALHLNVDQERLVTFPAPVRVGVLEGLSDALRTQIVDNTIYWKAARAFPVLRVQVQEIESGRLFLVDLKADKTPASNEPVEIAVPATTPDDGTPGSSRAVESTQPIGYVTLARFTSHQFYAPSRLAQSEPGIWPVPLRVEGPVRLIAGRHAGAIEAVPLAAWRTSSHFVTAVRLRNLGRAAAEIDPRTDIRGRWLAATAQHWRMLAAGDDADTTTLYLISSRAFEESF